MRKSVIICILLISNLFALAQSSDSVIIHRVLTSALTEKSGVLPEKMRFEYLTLRMEAGDIALVVYESTDYVVALGVNDSLGHQVFKADDPMFFKTIGSKIILPYTADAAGPRNFYFTSKDPDKTGKFKVNLFYYNKALNKINDNSPFCEKLKYICSNSPTRFEFLKGQSGRGILNNYFQPTINILPNTAPKISHNTGDYYRCRVESSSELEGMKKRYDELESQISVCLTNHATKVYTIDSVYDFEKKDFIRKVEFSLKGAYPSDLNGNHILSEVIDKVILSLSKDGDDKYLLLLQIE